MSETSAIFSSSSRYPTRQTQTYYNYTTLRIAACVTGFLIIVGGLLLLKQMSGIGVLTAGVILTTSGALVSSISILSFCIKKVLDGHNAPTDLKNPSSTSDTIPTQSKGANRTPIPDDYLVINGSSDLSNARVICFGDKHDNSDFQQITSELIQRYYRPGDIILVEALEAGKVVTPKQYQPFSGSPLPNGYRIEGWEPDNFKELSHNFNKEIDAMYQRILDLDAALKKRLPTKNYTKKDLDELKRFLPYFIAEYNELAEYFYVNVKNLEVLVNELFKRLEERTLSDSGNDILVFRDIIYKLFIKLEKNQNKALYKHITPEQAAESIANIPVRNASLCKSIEKALSTYNRVFVIAGLFHFSLSPATKPHLVEGIKTCLKKYPFVLIARKEDYQKFDLRKWNPEFPWSPLKHEHTRAY